MTKAELAQALEAANQKNETALVSFTTRIPTKLQTQIKAEAFSRGISVQTLVTEISRAKNFARLRLIYGERFLCFRS